MLAALVVWLVLIFGIAGGCSTEPVEREPVGILALGDSYTVGESVDKLDDWPSQLVRSIRTGGRGATEPTVVAATGSDTQDLMTALQLVDLESPFDVVTLQIGVNNQFRGGTLSDFEADLDLLTDMAIKHAGDEAGRVILLSIPDWGMTPFAEGAPRSTVASEIDAFNEVIRQQASKDGTHFVDVTEISRRGLAEPDLVAADGLHPSGKMYGEWVDLMLPVVSRIIE